MAAAREQQNTGAGYWEQIANADFLRLSTPVSLAPLLATGILCRYCTDVDVPYHVSIDEQTPSQQTGCISIEIEGAVQESEKTLVKARTLLASVDTLENEAVPVWIRQTVNEFVQDKSTSSNTRPTLGIATADLEEGLANSTVIHGSFSGKAERTSDMITEYGDTLRSALSLRLLNASNQPREAAAEIERFLASRELPGPFATSGGALDVLDVLSQTDPGLALTLLCDSNNSHFAIDEWKTESKMIHAAIRVERESVTDSIEIIASESQAVASVARLVWLFTDAAPVVIALNDTRIGISGVPDELIAEMASIEFATTHTPFGYAARLAGTEEEVIEEVEALQ